MASKLYCFATTNEGRRRTYQATDRMPTREDNTAKEGSAAYCGSMAIFEVPMKQLKKADNNWAAGSKGHSLDVYMRWY